jgi:hypothetical protein
MSMVAQQLPALNDHAAAGTSATPPPMPPWRWASSRPHAARGGLGGGLCIEPLTRLGRLAAPTPSPRPP